MEIKLEKNENEELVYSFVGMNFKQMAYLRINVLTKVESLEKDIAKLTTQIEKYKDTDSNKELVEGITIGSYLNDCTFSLKHKKALCAELEEISEKIKII